MMDSQVLKDRLKKFSIGCIKLVRSFGGTQDARVIGYQLIKSSTSSAANYRAAILARSSAEFYAKICIVVEEIDESLFWLELIIDSELITSEYANLLKEEALELTKIVVSTRASLKRRMTNEKMNK